MGEGRPRFSTAQPVRLFLSTVDDVRLKGKSSSSHFASPSPCRPVGFNPRHAWLHCLLFINLSTLAKMECAPEIWLSAPSILDTCPLSLSAPGLKRSSQAQSIRWLVGNLVHHGHSETGEKTDACWVTTTTLLLGTVGSRRPPPQLRSAEDYHNGSPSNGTSLATMRLQTQGNCPSWGVCFPPPTHPRVPCTRFKIGKPLSRLFSIWYTLRLAGGVLVLGSVSSPPLHAFLLPTMMASSFFQLPS